MVTVRFVMNRDGKVLSVMIAQSSGIEELDQEAQRLIWRAQPLPGVPRSIRGDRFTFATPVRFAFRDRQVSIPVSDVGR
ncbi:MAG: TonB family protein [Alphaproteobacteria bacterium]|nr:TonB family protein [Alphaproteobacteria bacterium]MCW5743078.1 TonB family protein [Alphaproteobacteria bacterium]